MDFAWKEWDLNIKKWTLHPKDLDLRDRKWSLRERNRTLCDANKIYMIGTGPWAKTTGPAWIKPTWQELNLFGTGLPRWRTPRPSSGQGRAARLPSRCSPVGTRGSRCRNHRSWYGRLYPAGSSWTQAASSVMFRTTLCSQFLNISSVLSHLPSNTL